MSHKDWASEQLRVTVVWPEINNADVTVDAAGFRATCENAVHCARRAGRVVQVRARSLGCGRFVIGGREMRRWR